MPPREPGSGFHSVLAVGCLINWPDAHQAGTVLRSLLSPSHLVPLIKRLMLREEIYSGSSVLEFTCHGYFIEMESYDLWSFGPSVGLLCLWGLLTLWASL